MTPHISEGGEAVSEAVGRLSEEGRGGEGPRFWRIRREVPSEGGSRESPEGKKSGSEWPHVWPPGDFFRTRGGTSRRRLRGRPSPPHPPLPRPRRESALFVVCKSLTIQVSQNPWSGRSSTYARPHV
jgi:hypothetical protein